LPPQRHCERASARMPYPAADAAAQALVDVVVTARDIATTSASSCGDIATTPRSPNVDQRGRRVPKTPPQMPGETQVRSRSRIELVCVFGCAGRQRWFFKHNLVTDHPSLHSFDLSGKKRDIGRTSMLKYLVASVLLWPAATFADNSTLPNLQLVMMRPVPPNMSRIPSSMVPASCIRKFGACDPNRDLCCRSKVPRLDLTCAWQTRTCVSSLLEW
jgi:hypothetical protein